MLTKNGAHLMESMANPGMRIGETLISLKYMTKLLSYVHSVDVKVGADIKIPITLDKHPRLV